MKQKLLSWLLCLGMLFAMLPVPTYAAGGDPPDQAVASVTVGGTTEYYKDLSTAIIAAQKAESATVCVLKSILTEGVNVDSAQTDAIICVTRGSITLEMAPGVFLGRRLSGIDGAPGYIVYNEGCNLTLKNCRFYLWTENMNADAFCIRNAGTTSITVSDSSFFASGQCTVLEPGSLTKSRSLQTYRRF